jgi:CO/xanthine dehydrogenase Mo-binding subunit
MIPPMLQANPQLDRWVRFEPDGSVRVAFGRMEYGQGVGTSLAQMAADELDVPFERVRVAAAATGEIPDEGLTVGSLSTEMSGPAIRTACAEVRALFVAAAAERLGVPAAELAIRDGAVMRGGSATGLDYWALAGSVDLARPATGEAPLKTVDEMRLIGRELARLDLPPKVFGAAFLHDLDLPGMRHARTLRQPGPKARLESLDRDLIHRVAGADVDILQEGAFVAVIAPTEAQAARALAAAQRAARWADAEALDPALGEAAALKTLPHEDHAAGAPAPEASNRRRIRATYAKPYVAHGSMGPSAGVAQFEDGRLTIWTHNQGVYPLRAMAARVTGLPAEAIEVIHAQGPGCYGHNGADDPPIEAAVIAVRRPGAPIRVQWPREDEFAWEPVGAAMLMELSAELDPSGQLVDYTAEVWSASHTRARGSALVETALPGLTAPKPILARTLPDGSRFSGGLLNAIPSYDIAASRTLEHLVEPPPVRTSSLRGLGGPPNTWAGESFVDELAEAAGRDPLAYRLDMLADRRGRAVLEKLAEMCGWARRGEAGTGRGLGLAYDRHRLRAAYCAVAAEVEVEREVRLVRLWCACDAGLIVNPDGARNQLEGGMVMAASWTLKEAVTLGGAGVASTTWGDYPILRFSEVPPIEIELLNVRDPRPFGVGEVSQGPCMGAISNAVAHALGARLRALPLTRERIAEALLAESERSSPIPDS